LSYLLENSSACLHPVCSSGLNTFPVLTGSTGSRGDCQKNPWKQSNFQSHCHCGAKKKKIS